MTDKLKINHSSSREGCKQFHDFSLKIVDKKLLDHDAKFQIIRKVTVLDTRPVNADSVIYEEQFRMNSNTASFRVPSNDLNSYNYEGQLIQISLIAKCTVNDGFIFDTKHSINFQIQYEPKNNANEEAELLIQPKDDFNMLRNY